MITNIILIAIGFGLLMGGAELLVGGASNIARKYRIPEIIIGLTIVSIGTSMPELMVSLTSAIQGHADLSIGNVVGSNLCNLLLILGITSLIQPLVFEKSTKRVDIPIMIIATALVFGIANFGGTISKVDGLILMTVFIGYIIYTIMVAKKSIENSKGEPVDEKQENIILSVIKVVAGIALLKFGGDISVDNAVIVAQTLGVSEKIIGVTIVAIGTSLPELITSVFAAVNKNIDIAIGNIVGSNIFNLLLILGASSIISPINYSLSYNKDFILLIIGSILLTVFANFGKKDTMTKLNGFVYILMYAGYMASTILI